ncbi:hypothetical protein GDO81_016777 [Engystomops pustulosus]|uniref:Uncharacterized protein n=1 Tax=Engystomops pustulosus TaxID=76066 RepID=A0AAV7A8G1_ENGPU|nr:hypothetical protein GDO81_016777 [Engystomops pustulosus]
MTCLYQQPSGIVACSIFYLLYRITVSTFHICILSVRRLWWLLLVFQQKICPIYPPNSSYTITSRTDIPPPPLPATKWCICLNLQASI